MAGATLLYTSSESDVKTAQQQGEYDADVLAREIARSAYNAAVSDVNRHGLDFSAALASVGTPVVSASQPAALKCANGRPLCYRRTGVMQGGRFVVEASQNGGTAIDIYTSGFYPYTTVAESGQRVRGEKKHEINEFHPVDILEVDPEGAGGKLNIQFVDSQAGYCSAIFLHRRLPGVDDAHQPRPEMVYAPGKNRNGDRNVGFEVDLAPGTQMNFGIGVDTNCGNGGSRPTSRPDLRMNAASSVLGTSGGAERLATMMRGYQYLESDWNWTHWALDPQSVAEGRIQEAPWGMVEVDPNNPQRWRISFEDIHNWNLLPDHPQYNNPNMSLAATKRFGYDWVGSFRTPGNDGVGNGWTDVRSYRITPERHSGVETGHYTVAEVDGPDGFHDLRNTGSPADFSDQVIFVEVVPDRSTPRSGVAMAL